MRTRRTRSFAAVVIAGLAAGSVAGAAPGGVGSVVPPVVNEHEATLATPVTAGDLLGSSVAIDGSTMVAGAPGDDLGAGAASGSVTVYVRDAAGAWSQQATLVPPGLGAGDRFGTSVALSGDRLVVGAPFDDTAAGADVGSAHMFRRSGGTWSYVQAITTTSALAAGDRFGAGVGISGTFALIGAPLHDPISSLANAGAVFSTVETGGAWPGAQRQGVGGAATNDQLGSSIAVSGLRAVAGTIGRDAVVGGSTVADAGAAVVYALGSGGLVSPVAVLTATDPGPGDQFGAAVDIDLDGVVVGAPQDDNVLPNQGAAYVFRTRGDGYAEEAKLINQRTGNGVTGGTAVTIDGDLVVMGVRLDGSPVWSGMATVWNRSGTGWTEVAQLQAPNPTDQVFFGSAVDASGDLVAVGAPQDDATVANSGAAYVFRPAGFSLRTVPVVEGTGANGSVPITINLGVAYPYMTTLHLTTEPGTARPYEDYTPINRSVTVPGGSTSVQVLVPIVADSAIEGTESFIVEVASSTGAPIDDGSVPVSITDDDTPPPLTASVADASRAEGNSGTANMQFTVTLSAAPTSTVTLRFTTSNGSAVAPGDFTARTNIALAFNPGQTSKNFTVPIVGDLVAEPTETFTLTMVSATGATIGDGVAVGTITDTDV